MFAHVFGNIIKIFNVDTKSKMCLRFFNNSLRQILIADKALEIFEFWNFMMILYNFSWLRNQNQIQSVPKKVDVIWTIVDREKIYYH